MPALSRIVAVQKVGLGSSFRGLSHNFLKGNVAYRSAQCTADKNRSGNRMRLFSFQTAATRRTSTVVPEAVTDASAQEMRVNIAFRSTLCDETASVNPRQKRKRLYLQRKYTALTQWSRFLQSISIRRVLTKSQTNMPKTTWMKLINWPSASVCT